VRAVEIFVLSIALTVAACSDGSLAVTDSGRWATVKSADAAASCIAAALGTDATAHRISAAPRPTTEIHAKVTQAGAPVYIISVTRVESGLTMIELRASDHQASLRAKAAAASCLG
jgi:hypothetical protein